MGKKRQQNENQKVVIKGKKIQKWFKAEETYKATSLLNKLGINWMKLYSVIH